MILEDLNLQTLINEAEVYHSQGLLEESKEKYLSALHYLGNNRGSDDYKNLISTVHERVNKIEEDIADFEKIDETPTLSHDVQNLIQKVFSFSQAKEMAEVEGVLALAKFGQYEQALVEFHRLLGKGIAPGVVAKHILECHLALSSPDAAIAQFGQWAANGLLTQDDLADARSFLENNLKEKGVEKHLPQLDCTPRNKKKIEGEQRGTLDIYSLKIQLDDEDEDLHEVDLDVTFQSNDTVSVVIPSDQRDLLNQFSLGMPLSKIKFYTPAAVFKGKGVISEKTEIKIGPKKGDYVLDIKIKAN
jgi:tetratricopeptide (TPR) repeat protein